MDSTSLDQAYAPPNATSASVDPVGKWRARSGWLFLIALGVFAGACVLLSVLSGGTRLGVVVFVLAAGIATLGAGYGAAAFVKSLSGGLGAWAAVQAFAVGGLNVGMMLVGSLAALLSTASFTRGRQIRSFGKIQLPPVVGGAAWTAAASSMSSIDRELPADDAATRRALAEQWRENGRTEHASVAAFARLTLDLMALGAPPDLVIDANRDALDEIRHAQLCFGLARALDGREESPGAFPEASRARTLSSVRVLALGQLAVDSLVDGALHEGLSARVIAKLARRCEVSAITVMLKEIAADEGKHARHGWDVVLWCLAEGGEPVARALEGALFALPETMVSPLPEAARGGAWERFGIMGEALEAEEHAATRAYVVRRTMQAIAAQRAARQVALGYGSTSLG